MPSLPRVLLEEEEEGLVGEPVVQVVLWSDGAPPLASGPTT